MTDSQRTQKQVIVAVVLFLILGSIGSLSYWRLAPAQPSPTPNPTANLAPIQVTFTKLFNVENNDYDFLAKVNNPNTDYGSGDVEYVLSFYGSNNQLISSKTGSFYILSGQTKYVIDSPLKFQEPIDHFDFKIQSVDWQKLQPLAASGATLLVKNVAYSQVSQPGIFARVGGQVFDSSDLDLNRVDVAVVILDANQEPVAINQTNILTFLARTTRGFEVTWFSPFVGQMGRIDVEANANLFENSNFLRQYGGQEKFKQLY